MMQPPGVDAAGAWDIMSLALGFVIGSLERLGKIPAEVKIEYLHSTGGPFFGG